MSGSAPRSSVPGSSHNQTEQSGGHLTFPQAARRGGAEGGASRGDKAVMVDVSSRVARHAGVDKLFADPESRTAFLDPTPNILLCGLPRSGKTSIVQVVFFKTSPHETLYCEPTETPELHTIANTRLVKFCLVDLPGRLLLDTQFDEVLFHASSSLIFVIDAQSEPYAVEIAHCKSIFKRAWQINPRINLEVFIHKIDGDVFAVDEVRADCQRDIHAKLMSHLHEEGVAAKVVFYSTSIYDHTIFEACSRVVQRLIPQAATLEQLLDLLVANCRMEKAFLIDVLSKTFVATDTSPFDPFNYELCTDMVEVVTEISCIYGSATDEASQGGSGKKGEEDAEPASTSSLIELFSDYILYLREVDRLVALACVVRKDNFFDRQHLVDYNIRVFRDAMLALFAEDPSTLPSRSATQSNR